MFPRDKFGFFSKVNFANDGVETRRLVLILNDVGIFIVKRMSGGSNSCPEQQG